MGQRGICKIFSASSAVLTSRNAAWKQYGHAHKPFGSKAPSFHATRRPDDELQAIFFRKALARAQKIWSSICPGRLNLAVDERPASPPTRRARPRSRVAQWRYAEASVAIHAPRLRWKKNQAKPLKTPWKARRIRNKEEKKGELKKKGEKTTKNLLRRGQMSNAPR